mmetsp:Transcript_18737/g.38078  ORF Transcript_18737/g.38078 Transcript_18737/m.38078 type:complete len:307 (+) Transcript_18737:1-921(+)
MEADSSLSPGMKFTTYGEALRVKVRTEDPSFGTHGVFFNRGCAGSQAYAAKFGEFRKFHRVEHGGHIQWKSVINPREIPVPEKSKEALAWLSRGLEEALLGFISKATGNGYQIRAAVYEFTHKETLQALADAIERGVDVKIIRHCKYAHHSGDDTLIPDDATRSAEEAIAKVAFHSLESAQKWQDDTFIERSHSSDLMHNKFIVLTMNGHPFEVWTGSVNFTDSGKNIFVTKQSEPISSLTNDNFLCLSQEYTVRVMLGMLYEIMMWRVDFWTIGTHCQLIAQDEVMMETQWMTMLNNNNLISLAE